MLGLKWRSGQRKSQHSGAQSGTRQLSAGGVAVLIREKVNWRAGMSGSRVREDSSKKCKKWSSKASREARKNSSDKKP